MSLLDMYIYDMLSHASHASHSNNQINVTEYVHKFELCQMPNFFPFSPSNFPSVFPTSPPSDGFHNIHQAKQNGDFNKGPNRRCQSLITVGTICSDGDGDCQLEIVAGCSKALRRCQLISKAKLMRHQEGQEEDNPEVNN